MIILDLYIIYASHHWTPRRIIVVQSLWWVGNDES